MSGIGKSTWPVAKSWLCLKLIPAENGVPGKIFDKEILEVSFLEMLSGRCWLGFTLTPKKLLVVNEDVAALTEAEKRVFPFDFGE
jgi:hypothetical protein